MDEALISLSTPWLLFIVLAKKHGTLSVKPSPMCVSYAQSMVVGINYTLIFEEVSQVDKDQTHAIFVSLLIS